MKKRLIALVTLLGIFCSAAGMLTGCGSTTDNNTTAPTEEVLLHAHDVGNGKQWMPWEHTDSLPTDGDSQYNYYLTADVHLSSTVTLSTDTGLGLCLNGYNITAAAGERVYNLAGQVKLHICDCTAQPGTIYPSEADGGAFQLHVATAGLTLENVTVDGTGIHTGSAKIGAIHINNCGARVKLIGTTIKGCRAKNGSAIYAVGKPNEYATVEILDGSSITGNTVMENKEGSAAVLGKYAGIVVSDSSLTDNVSKSICGVALSFANGGALKLHNAVITGNHSAYENYQNGQPYNIQVGAIYIHNGSRRVAISGDTVIYGNTRFDGLPADLYLQVTVRQTDPDKYPQKLQIKLGTLTEKAKIHICTNEAYTAKDLRADINEIPLLSLEEGADGSNWQEQWITFGDNEERIVYNPAVKLFQFVKKKADH